MKAAVIGLGPHGRRIVDVLRDFPGVELAAVVDRSESALAAVELPPSVARCRSAEELWSAGDISLVCVATNGPSHAALAKSAMKAGARYVLVEKPMACSLAECDQILTKARETQTRVAVDHARRHAPAYQWLRSRIESQDWGRVRTIWMQRPGIGLACNATHSFDVVTFLTGAAVERVIGWVDEPIGTNPRGEQFVDPGGLVVMELSGGARAIVAQIEDGAGPTSLEIDMTAARIRLDEQSGAIDIVDRDLSVKPGVASSHDNPLGAYEANVLATFNVLEACRRGGGVEAIVAVSSNHVYGDQHHLPTPEDAPLNGLGMYAASKLAGDILARAYGKTYGLPVGIARMTNSYGGDDHHVAHIITAAILSALKNERPVIKHSGKDRKGYLYIKDTTEGLLAVAEGVARSQALRGEAFNLVPNEAVTVIDLVRAILATLGRPLEIEVQRPDAPHEEEHLDNSKARRLLGWAPQYGLETGLQETVDWYTRSPDSA